MLYNYGLVEIKPKLNKKKVFFVVLIVLLIIGMIAGSVFLVIYYQNKKKEDMAIAKVQEQRRIEEERIAAEEEAKRKKEEERLKNSQPLTEEQIQAVENIYDDVGYKRVFLTFDDGPTTTVTPFILDLLKQENIKATFFVLGNRARANPDLVKREFEEGHYIANHSNSHIYSQIYSSVESTFNEYNITEQYIQEALENPDYHTRVFRFPGGSVGGYYRNIKSVIKQSLRENNIVSLDWNCLSKDAEGAKTKEELLQNVIATSEGKQSVVVLMHDAADKILTYETLPDVINYFRDNGYEFKNLYDIL